MLTFYDFSVPAPGTITTINLATAVQADLDIDVTDCDELIVTAYGVETSGVVGVQFEIGSGYKTTSGDYRAGNVTFSGDAWAAATSLPMTASGSISAQRFTFRLGGFRSGVRAYMTRAYYGYGTGGDTRRRAGITTFTDEVLTVQLGTVGLYVAGTMVIQKVSHASSAVITAVNLATNNSPWNVAVGSASKVVAIGQNWDAGANRNLTPRLSDDNMATVESGAIYTDANLNEVGGGWTGARTFINLSNTSRNNDFVYEFDGFIGDNLISAFGVNVGASTGTPDVRTQGGTAVLANTTHVSFHNYASANGYNSGAGNAITYTYASEAYSTTTVSSPVATISFDVTGYSEARLVCPGGMTLSATDVIIVQLEIASSWVTTGYVLDYWDKVGKIMGQTSVAGFLAGGSASASYYFDLSITGLEDGAVPAFDGFITKANIANDLVSVGGQLSGNTGAVTGVRLILVSGNNFSAGTVQCQKIGYA